MNYVFQANVRHPCAGGPPCCCPYYPPEPHLWLHVFALCSPFVCFSIWTFCCAPPAILLDAGTREGPKQLLQQCRRRRRCHLVCVFPNSFLTNIERHGGDVPAQAARRTPGGTKTRTKLKGCTRWVSNASFLYFSGQQGHKPRLQGITLGTSTAEF